MTLTEVSFYSRKFAPFGVIVILILLIFFYAFRVFFLYLDSQKSTATTYDAGFGQIKPPVMQEATSSGQLSFSLDTVEGEPVTATDSARVFFLPPTSAKFGFQEKILLMAKTIGFSTDTKYALKTDTQAVFSEPTQSLAVDITNYNFTYEYDVAKDPALFTSTNIPPQEQAEAKAKDFLNAVGRYPAELAKGKTNTSYLLYDPINGHLASAKPAEANIVEVDFYRPDIDAVPQPIAVVSPRYFSSQNYVIMLFNETGFKIIKAQVAFFEKSEGEVHTYPVINGEAAFEALKNGKYLLSSGPATSGAVAIKKMFLGYFDPEVYQEHLQPVYVFLGDNNFVGYVPALPEKYFLPIK